MIPFGDFKKLDLITARVVNVRDHPNADKLYVLEIDTGREKKEIVAGIKSFYPKKDLIGRDIVLISNLEPAMIRGVESQGMLLAAEDENGISIITPDRTVSPGSKIK